VVGAALETCGALGAARRESAEALRGGAGLGAADADERAGAFATVARWDREATLGSVGSEETADATSAAPTETPSSAPSTLSPEPTPEATPVVADAPPGPGFVGLPAMVA
jgi:hypothetical protein